MTMEKKPKPRRGWNRRDKKTGDPLPPGGIDPLATASDSQAKRVILRFGGVQNLVRFMLRAGIRRTPMSIYQWVYKGGLIPPSGVRDVFLAEAQAGIQLTDADWSPYTLVDESAPVQSPPEPIRAPETGPLHQAGVSITPKGRVL